MQNVSNDFLIFHPMRPHYDRMLTHEPKEGERKFSVKTKNSNYVFFDDNMRISKFMHRFRQHLTPEREKCDSLIFLQHFCSSVSRANEENSYVAFQSMRYKSHVRKYRFIAHAIHSSHFVVSAV